MRSVIWTVEYVVQAARMDSLQNKALDGLDQDAEWVSGQNHRPYNAMLKIQRYAEEIMQMKYILKMKWQIAYIQNLKLNLSVFIELFHGDFFPIVRRNTVLCILKKSQLDPIDWRKLHKKQHVSTFFGKSVLKCHLT